MGRINENNVKKIIIDSFDIMSDNKNKIKKKTYVELIANKIEEILKDSCYEQEIKK